MRYRKTKHSKLRNSDSPKRNNNKFSVLKFTRFQIVCANSVLSQGINEGTSSFG